MEFKDKQSIYLQIADFVCEQILLAKWPPGERISSVRDLASEMEVNPNTVMRTYEFLQGREIIFNKRGIGYFASENAIDLILSYRKERFLENELPEVFKTLYLLKIDINEFQDRYNHFLSEIHPSTH
jgi:GntR family transcriptional regulator